MRYNAFGPYMKRLFGASVHKVNIDAGFTCPNRDGTLGVRGCIYCNNDSFRPSSCTPSLSVAEQIKNGISYLKKRYRAEKFLAYFQPFSNTYASVDVLERLYREALRDPAVVGLSIGTRPDCIDPEKLSMLEGLAGEKFILLEYGLQSIHEKSLSFIERGHGYRAFLDAIRMTKGRGIHIGAHIIVGLPTETKEESLSMAGEVSALEIEFLKIHQLQVVRDTPLAEIYYERPFHVFGYDEYLEFLSEFIGRLSPKIVLQRLFATAPDSILIAPRWNRGRHEILRDMERKLEEKDAYQGKYIKHEVMNG